MNGDRNSKGAGILHADLDAFFASVAQRDHPELRGRPVGVGPGIITAASYEARAYGVRGAMPESQARSLCPGLVVVPGDFDAYSEASKAVFAIFEDTTPLVEGISVDEAFLDVRGLARSAGSPTEIAVRLRERVRDEVGLPLSIGIARTKFLAKVASVSAKPDGLCVVAPEGEREFLHPLPVRRMWGVGPATEATLLNRGIQTVEDLATVGEAVLVKLLGHHTGRHLYALSMGHDPRSVTHRPRRRSFGAQRALGRRGLTPEQLDVRLVELIDGLARRLRDAERCATTVTLRLRFGDYTRATRSRTVSHPTDRTDLLVDVARRLLAANAALLAERGCTLIGASVSGLVPHRPQQLVLPFEGVDRRALDETLDAVRDRYGRSAISRTANLTHRRHRPMPTLPEPPSGVPETA